MNLCECGCGIDVARRFVRGHSMRGIKHSEETRKKISQSNSRRKYSEETRKKMSENCSFRRSEIQEKARQSHLGKKRSRESVEKQRQAVLGRRHSEEAKEKIRQAHIGKEVSKETREKIGRASLGRRHTEETRENISRANRGRKLKLSEVQRVRRHEVNLGRVPTLETREKLSRAHRGRKLSVEHRLKLSLSQRARLEKDAKSRFKYTKEEEFTAIEHILKEELDRRSIKYEHNRRVGRFYPDFIIFDNIIVECDGEYWHSLPRMKNREAERDAHLISKGFKMIRLSEQDIRSNIESCVDNIESFAKEFVA